MEMVGDDCDKGRGDSLAATVLTEELAGNEEEYWGTLAKKGRGIALRESVSIGPLLMFVHSKAYGLLLRIKRTSKVYGDICERLGSGTCLQVVPVRLEHDLHDLSAATCREGQ